MNSTTDFEIWNQNRLKNARPKGFFEGVFSWYPMEFINKTHMVGLGYSKGECWGMYTRNILNERLEHSIEPTKERWSGESSSSLDCVPKSFARTSTAGAGGFLYKTGSFSELTAVEMWKEYQKFVKKRKWAPLPKNTPEEIVRLKRPQTLQDFEEFLLATQEKRVDYPVGLHSEHECTFVRDPEKVKNYFIGKFTKTRREVNCRSYTQNIVVPEGVSIKIEKIDTDAHQYISGKWGEKEVRLHFTQDNFTWPK